ncbi:MAG: hypothetical protein ACXVP5_12000 [Tumebacillaceae bacterium]
MSADQHEQVQVTPEELINDYLIGAYELEKLKNGFQAPVEKCVPCDEHRDFETQ